MTRDWQPGDVAMVRNEHGVWNRAILQVHPRRDVWQYGVAMMSDDLGREARPLAVIDPENREQVDDLCKALVEAMHKAGDVASAANGVHPATVALALREFADPKPPKPDEPTNWLAVVEDADGKEWARVSAETSSWARRGHISAPTTWRTYAEITPVRVLSEGVQ